MKELGQILEAWRGGSGGVLATVVQVKGSAYRRPGARLLILPDGRRIGSVSGGCLEGDLSRKAWWLTESGRPVLRTYDTTSDEDAVFEFGLGCNGVIDVLLERLEFAESDSVMRVLSHARECREIARVATVIRGPQTGLRLWLEDGGTAGSLRNTELACDIEPLLRNAQRSYIAQRDASEVFIEVVEPPQSLVVYGSGPDTIPLANFAKELGWSVSETVSRDSAVVLMTHNFAQDLSLLPGILAQKPRYLGILGPRVRTDRLFQDLQMEPPSCLYAPVGLDIGSGSPEAIALAIVSEISAVLSGRSGCMLRERQTPIYDHPVINGTAYNTGTCNVLSV